MKKKLIVCPICEQNGTINILGEIKDNGDLAILRFHQGETIVKGDSFSVVCGICKNIIYLRNRKILHWSYWQSKQFIAKGTPCEK